jgi:hypothetical protein
VKATGLVLSRLSGRGRSAAEGNGVPAHVVSDGDVLGAACCLWSTRSPTRCFCRLLFDSYEPADENAFVFNVVGRSVWELSHRNAGDEAARLIPQAQQIRSKLVDWKVLAQPSRASMMPFLSIRPEPAMPVGVILDGHASGEGDPSRGARFNSAVRYHDDQRGHCLVIIVSEDGMINLLPDLPRQVARTSVEKVVHQLEESLTDDPDYEIFFRYWEHLESLAFYLTAEQCGRINAAWTRLEEHRARPESHPRDPNEGSLGFITRVSWTPFTSGSGGERKLLPRQ